VFLAVSASTSVAPRSSIQIAVPVHKAPDGVLDKVSFEPPTPHAPGSAVSARVPVIH
jgi:hypothetical protein